MLERLQKIRDGILSTLTDEEAVGDVAIEQYLVGPTKRARVAQSFYLHGIVGVGLMEARFPEPLMIAPPTLKKWWGASGADKSKVRDGIEEFLKIAVHPDHNVVDALGLAIMLMQKHLWASGRFSPSKYQVEKMRAWKRMMT